MAEADAPEPLDTTTEVETPEHVRFRYHVAGPARRAMAYVIDGMIRGGILIAIAIVASIAGLGLGDDLGQASQGIILFVLFCLEWGYYVFCEMLWAGRTPGKRAMHLRVVGETGHPITFRQSVMRNLLRAADFLPTMYALGALVMGRDERFRRLGDLAAGTMVVVEDRHVVGGPLNIMPPPTAREVAHLPQRLPLDGEDLEAIELLLRREGLLGPAREQELAEMIAPMLARRVGVKYRDPVRFLKIVYARARGLPIMPDAPERGPSAGQQQQGWPGGQQPWGPQQQGGWGPGGYGPGGQAPGGYGPGPGGYGPGPGGYGPGPGGYGPGPGGYGPGGYGGGRR
jgi:uncharacterized RDD family membrane protein YckC